MPIYLDDISSITNAKPRAHGPKFFRKELTGNGKSTGLLNDLRRPGRYGVGRSWLSTDIAAYDNATRTSANDVTTWTIPMGLLTTASVRASLNTTAPITQALPHVDDLFHINAGRSKNVREVYFGLTPQGMILSEDKNGDSTVRRLDILYRMEIYALDANSTLERVTVRDHLAPSEEGLAVAWSIAPLDDAEDFIAAFTAPLSSNPNGVFVDVDDLAQWMADYDLYERVCELSEKWATDTIGDEICLHIEEVFAHGKPSARNLNVLVAQLRLLESYRVSLDAYLKIQQTLARVCSPADALTLSKQNMNLHMGHNMTDLADMKDQLETVKAPAGMVFAPARPLSTQQSSAVNSKGPLDLVLSGAGTGKSTTILARIEYMVQAGVPLEDITVLSFTNAAANNIREKNPGVGSMTIASMIHEIYTLNYPTHGLSQIETILNSLDIYFPQSDMAHAFRSLLFATKKKGESGALTALSNFVEKYFDEVIKVLDTLGQTCLELEIIIAYLRIEDMQEPAKVLSRHLIVDEVQDNSIFEFIYILKYVAKHKESLFIVGDASQTLYEFRASNPRALNTLEKSGIFNTHQLTTNYRSNQEILDFANVHLADIEANQTSAMRLQANSLALPSADTFKEKVTLNYITAKTDKEFKESYDAYLQNVVDPWVQDRLDKGEKVAFLMHKRDDVSRTEAKLKELHPSKSVVNLVSEKTWPTTVFSQFVKMYWNEVCQVPDVAHALLAISQGIKDNLAELTRQQNLDKTRPKVEKMITDWWLENSKHINGWVGLVKAQQWTRDQFFDELRTNLLSYEITHNKIRQSVTNHKNREKKESNLVASANLLVSTVHGAKGLEFDHVVVVHKFSSQMEEADKRMYYVAFTRAMKSEFILSHGTVKKPRITSDYDLIVDALEKRDAQNALRAQGVDIDAMSKDEVESALATFFEQREAAEEADGEEQDVDGSSGFQATTLGTAGGDDSTAPDQGEPVEDGSAFTG